MLVSSAKSVHFLMQECGGGRLCTKRRSSNRLLIEIVMFSTYRDAAPTAGVRPIFPKAHSPTDQTKASTPVRYGLARVRRAEEIGFSCSP